MRKENWIEITGYEDYQVSDLGNVRNFKLGKNGVILIPRKTNGKYQLVRVHRLVATAFVPKREGMNIVNHLDGNKLNNQPTI